jgi:hypothetical protein
VVKVAIIAEFLTKWNMEIYTGHIVQIYFFLFVLTNTYRIILGFLHVFLWAFYGGFTCWQEPLLSTSQRAKEAGRNFFYRFSVIFFTNGA